MPEQVPVVDVSALVTAFRRWEPLAQTLERIAACNPVPREIVVHVDGGDEALIGRVRERFPAVRVLASRELQGCGGSRNVLMREASFEICACFDDDSRPSEDDYFARVLAAFAELPDAWIITGREIDRRPQPWPSPKGVVRIATFVGGASGYRRSLVSRAGTYVSLSVGYGMEELDLALRVWSLGGRVYFHPGFAVVHDTDHAHRGDPRLNAASLQNVALHGFLRYPAWLWPLAALQVASYVARGGAVFGHRGMAAGLAGIPAYLWRHRSHRRTVPGKDVLEFVALKRKVARLARLS